MEVKNPKSKVQNLKRTPARRTAFLLLFTAFTALCAQDKFISADNPLIRYSGRFDMRNKSAPRFDWPGNIIELRFSGTSCAVKLRGDGGLYNIFINDSQFVAHFDTLETVYPLVGGLQDSTHSLRITKRFESKPGQIAVIKGFYIDSEKNLHPLDEEPFYKIEFIGGSNLLGFGTEANVTSCDTPSIYSNTYLSFGPVAARELGAQYHIIAMSGKGLLRNWGSPFLSTPSDRTFRTSYIRTVRSDHKSRWNFKSWVPHVVVISFGNNDFSTKPHTPKELFTAHYRNFINEVKMRNPNAQIVCMTSSREPFKSYVKEIVEREREEGNSQIHFYSFAPVPRRECGCDWHPGAAAQARIGRELADVIRPLLAADN